jgi:hypothetical protein
MALVPLPLLIHKVIEAGTPKTVLKKTVNENHIERAYGQSLTDRIVLAARDAAPVNGLTHGFYRYPARFSPIFVRSVIEAFSEPGDWVIDPFAGGGTTLVEAMALGRNALGIDISSLSAFVCEAKTTILRDQEIASFERWRSHIPETINIRAPGKLFESYADAGYFRNLGGREFWRLRKAIEQSLASVERLRLHGSAVLARCVVLRTAQWALDARKKRPSVPEFRDRLYRLAEEMIESAKAFREQIEGSGHKALPRAVNLHRSTAGAHTEELVREVSPPKLIVTSPPYPGVHVLYHRWQVDGRRETPAPFWIAGKLDGAGSSYYTMGDRKNPELRSYFDSLEASFTSVVEIAGPEMSIPDQKGPVHRRDCGQLVGSGVRLGACAPQIADARQGALAKGQF